MTPYPSTAFARELRDRLEQEGGFDGRPRELADLVCLVLDPLADRAPVRHELQRALLRETIAHARAGTGFYHDPVYAEWREVAPGEPPDLSCWPLVTRREVIDRFDDFISNEVDFSFACHTSGTTGPSLSIYKSNQEVGFIRAFYDRMFEPLVETLPSRPLMLSFPNLYHGVGLPLPAPGKVFVSGVTDDTLIEDARKVVERRYSIPGHDPQISILSGLVFHVQFFTSYLIEQGVDLPSLGIQTINVSGGYAARSTRRFMADAWHAMVFDRYSLTEVVGGASRCLRCDHFHLDPQILAEVVDDVTGDVLEEGVGRLVLTPLYPFVQMQPLIRYDTGDLVRRSTDGCPGQFTFEFLGKAKNCVRRNGGGDWLLFSVDLYEAMIDLPDVAVYEWFRAVRVARDRTVGARQLYRLETEDEPDKPLRLRLEVELRYAPHVFPERVEELREKIAGFLGTANPAFAQAVAAGDLVFETTFGGPGTLGDHFIIKT